MLDPVWLHPEFVTISGIYMVGFPARHQPNGALLQLSASGIAQQSVLGAHAHAASTCSFNAGCMLKYLQV